MASLLRERARPDPEEPFWTLVLGAKLLLAATLMLGLAAAGLLSAFSCIAVCVAAAAVAEAALRRFRPAAPAPPPSRRGLTQAAIAAGTAAIFLRLVLARLKPTSETDSVVHLGLLAKWIQQGEGIYNFPYSYSSFYEASLLPALAVGKYDALISLLSLQSVALFAAALFHISRRVLSTPLAAGAATLHGALYYHLWAGVSGVGTAKNDMIYNAGILLFVLGFIRLFRGERGPATVALAALGAAFAAVKFSGPFAALIVVISAGWAFAAAGRIREFLGGIRAGMPAVLAVALFTNGHFYLRNLLLHGNPLYPQKLKVLGFMLPGTVDFSGTSILSQWDNPLIWRAFLATVQEGFFYPGSVVAPFLLAAAALPLKRLRGGSPVLFLALTASGLWLLFMASLWSAGMYPGQTDIIQARLSLRYASAAAALGTLAIAAAAEGIWPRAAMVVTAAVAADAAHRWYRLLPTTWYLRAAGVDAGLASGAGLIVLAAAFAARRRLRPYVFAAIYAILLLSLPRLAERIRPVAWAGGEADVFQHLALAPASTVWSIVGEDTWHLIYPLTGGRYQHRVIEVDTQTASRRLEKCEDLPEYVHIHGYSDFPSKTRARLEPGLTGCGFNPLSQSPYGILFRRMQG